MIGICASGRETLLECCVVLSFYHEFTTTDGGQGQERIGLKVEEHEWAKLDSDNKKKSRILTIAASVSLIRNHHCRSACCPSGVWRRLCQLTHLLATELGHIVLPHGAEQRPVVILQPWK